MSRFTSRRKSRLTVSVGLVGLLGLSMPMSSAHAAVGGGSVYDVKAEAFPFQAMTSNGSIPVTQGFEGYGPYARTNLNSIGSSDALASAPFPGEVATGGSGLAQSVTGVQLPDYPFFLLSAAGDDPKDKNFPGIALHTESGSNAAVARAIMGDDFSGGKATARSEMLSNGDVRALAQSSFDLFQFGSSFSISGLQTQAAAEAAPDGKVTRTSSLSFDRIALPGLRYETPCKVPPQIPLPGDLPCQNFAGLDFSFTNGQFFSEAPDGTNQKVPVSPDAVISAFKAIGVDATYQGAKETPTGIRGAGMTFDYDTADVPENPSGYKGITHQHFAIGFSSASATQHTDGVSSAAPSAGQAAATDTAARTAALHRSGTTSQQSASAVRPARPALALADYQSQRRDGRGDWLLSTAFGLVALGAFAGRRRCTRGD